MTDDDTQQRDEVPEPVTEPGDTRDPDAEPQHLERGSPHDADGIDPETDTGIDPSAPGT